MATTEGGSTDLGALVREATEQFRGALQTTADAQVMEQRLMASIDEKVIESEKRISSDLQKSVLSGYNTRIEALSVMVQELNQKVSEGSGGEHKKREGSERCMTTRRNFSGLPKYNGKHEDYDDWKFKMRTFMSEETEFKELLVCLDDQKEVPVDGKALEILEVVKQETRKTHPDRDVSVAWINHRLYQILCSNLEGKALNMVKNLSAQKDTNGIIGWCKLASDSSSMTAQRLQGLAGKVFHPKRCKSYSEVNAAIEEWELHVAEFAKAGETLNPVSRTYSIRQIVPEELERDIVRASSVLTDYEMVRKYIVEQVAVRRDVKNASKGPVQMDLNAMLAAALGEGCGEEEAKTEDDTCAPCGGEAGNESVTEQLFSFIKGLKGGQKGGFGKGGKDCGKPRFEGNCNYCGIYGHRVNECRKKDTDMGKGGGGKGDWGKNCFGKGGGFGGKAGTFGGTFGNGGKGFYGKGGKGAPWGQKGGSAYGFQDTTGQYSGGAWTLSLSKDKVGTPPGLKTPDFSTTNKWVLFDREENADEETQRSKDLKEMEANYETEFPKEKIGNYSRKSVKEKMRPVAKRDMVPLKEWTPKVKELNLLYNSPVPELHPCISGAGTGGGQELQGKWECIKGVMDSGASESVSPPHLCADYEVRPSVGSKMGQKYTSASGETIPNLGEKLLDVVMEDGLETQIRYQACDVTRTLNSVSEICDAGGEEGQYVLFSKWGGTVINPQTGRRTPFAREEGIYTLDMWVRPKATDGGGASVFPRPGK